uniref:Uncharacterized protein n=1 Tax=Prevotella sp. GTC17259 TaxID=3236795 RepID=A0AB33IYS0_9BACT
MEILKSLLLSTFIILCINACRDIHEHEKITLVNQSGDTIAFQAQSWRYITEKDTLFEGGLASDYIIAPDSQWVFRSMNPYWKENFTLIPYFQILIMDGDKYWQYYVAPADTVRKYVPVLCRYQLTQPGFREGELGHHLSPYEGHEGHQDVSAVRDVRKAGQYGEG